MGYPTDTINRVFELKNQGYSNRAIADEVFGRKTKESTVRYILNNNTYYNEDSDEPVEDKDLNYFSKRLVQQQKTIQSQADKLNTFRRIHRNLDREVNYQKELFDNLLQAIEDKEFTPPELGNTIYKDIDNDGNIVGVIQLSDLHFGECTDVSYSKNHDIYQACHKLKHFISEAVTSFLNNEVSRVLIAFTGDLMNSDRRLDELTMNSSTRAKTLVESVDILQQVISDVSKYFEKVYVASVIGNESRIGEFVSWAGHTATDNFDYIIHKLLERMFKDSEIVTFIDIDFDVFERVIDIDGFKLLITHGNNKLASKTPEAEVQKLKGRWADKGEIIDYVIFGHIHSTMISDTFARSASLVGGNGYSDKNLNLSSKASQNYYIINTDKKTINATSVDLENTKSENPYNYSPDYEKFSYKDVSGYEYPKSLAFSI